jgi:hypothetical protein
MMEADERRDEHGRCRECGAEQGTMHDPYCTVEAALDADQSAAEQHEPSGVLTACVAVSEAVDALRAAAGVVATTARELRDLRQHLEGKFADDTAVINAHGVKVIQPVGELLKHKRDEVAVEVQHVVTQALALASACKVLNEMARAPERERPAEKPAGVLIVDPVARYDDVPYADEIAPVGNANRDEAGADLMRRMEDALAVSIPDIGGTTRVIDERVPAGSLLRRVRAMAGG